MGLRIAKFIRTQNENLAARTIRDYPEIVFYDDADIYLCLIISFNPAELNKLLEESMKNPRTSTEILPENPFRRQILRWEFLNRWGNRQEQKEAKRYLDEAKLEAFTHFLIRGNLPGSGVSKKKVTEAYKTILEDFQGFFDGRVSPNILCRSKRC